MANVITVKLTKPFVMFGKQVESIKLKEPTGRLYGRLGEPRLLIHTAGNSGYLVEQPDIIREYLEECVDHELLGADVLNQLSLADAMRLKDALLQFFTVAAAASTASRLTSSSSNSASSDGSTPTT